MKKAAGILTTVIILLIACNNSIKKANADREVYQKATETLQEKEKKNPIGFLIISIHNKHNLLGQTVIKGKINNLAKVCTYKDVQLELSFFSKTGALLEKDLETIYNLVAPGQSSDFKTKYFAPKGTDSVGIKVVSAKING